MNDAETLVLRCHPACERGGVERLEVRVRRAATSLTLRFRVEGLLERLVVPAARPVARREGLWRRTCFEAFVRAAGAAGYAEFNLSPSGEWAAYRFDGYRSGMGELAVAPAPAVEVTARDGGVLEVTVTIARVPEPWGSAEVLEIGVSAVLEDEAGTLAYWALAHPAGAPDFHDPAGFALTIGAG